MGVQTQETSLPRNLVGVQICELNFRFGSALDYPWHDMECLYDNT